TLALTGPNQPGFSPLPVQFSYHITGGKGAYAHLSGQGTLSLVLATQPEHGGADNLDGPHGAFALAVSLQGQPGATLDGALAGHFTPAPVAVVAGAFYSLTGAGTLVGVSHVSLTGLV